MKLATIVNGEVTNVTLPPPGYTPQEGELLVSGNVGPGWKYDGTNLTAPKVRPNWTDTDLDQRYWWIDKGPFFDRFGAKALAIVSSTDAQVQGLVSLIYPRNYIDLKRQDLPNMLGLLVAKGLITSAEKDAVLTTPTTDYERHIKDLPQPL